MSFIRFILIFILVYLIIRLLGRWFLSSQGGDKVAGDRRREKGSDYSTLTDQKIEDADFEEIKEEKNQ